MSGMVKLTWQDVRARAYAVASEIVANVKTAPGPSTGQKVPRIYGVPNGGLIPATLVCEAIQSTYSQGAELVEDIRAATHIVDDIIDSGDTYERILKQTGRALYPLVNKKNRDACWQEVWVSFPWERMGKQDGPHDNIKRILQYIGDKPEREGLLETPDRVVKSYSEIFSGYRVNPAELFKVFEDGACDEMVIVRDIEFYSMCEHHMLPFFGSGHIAYLPNGKVVGLSKLARVLDACSRKLQMQERIGEEVTKLITEHLQPKGAACILNASHFCMMCRGVGKQHSTTITSSLTGAFRDPTVRAELMALLHLK